MKASSSPHLDAVLSCRLALDSGARALRASPRSKSHKTQITHSISKRLPQAITRSPPQTGTWCWRELATLRKRLSRRSKQFVLGLIDWALNLKNSSQRLAHCHQPGRPPTRVGNFSERSLTTLLSRERRFDPTVIVRMDPFPTSHRRDL